jgi:hypothetical protein
MILISVIISQLLVNSACSSGGETHSSAALRVTLRSSAFSLTPPAPPRPAPARIETNQYGCSTPRV